MLLVRLGADTSQVGADVRAALTSWGRGDSVLGGVALVGAELGGGLPPVTAIVVMPDAVIVVAGVDLPEPAMRLDSPLDAAWKADGWPLTTQFGAVNPAGEGLTATAVVARRLRDHGLTPDGVHTLITVGPFVAHVVMPAEDLKRNVRVLHPTPMSLLAAAREFGAHEQPRTVEDARRLITALFGGTVKITDQDLADEGFHVDSVDFPHVDFPHTVTAAAPAEEPIALDERAMPTPPPAPVPHPPPGASNPWWSQWLPIAAALLIGALLLVVIAAAMGSPASQPSASAAFSSAPPPHADITFNGVRLRPEGSTERQNCAAHAYGQARVWLARHGCTTLIRSVYQTTVDGRPAAVAVIVVGFADSSGTRSFADMIRTPGNGGVLDPVTDGDGWLGGPKSFDGAASIVTLQDISVREAKAVWIGKPSDPNDPHLLALLERCAGLPAIP